MHEGRIRTWHIALSAEAFAKLWTSFTGTGDGTGMARGLFHLTCSVTILPGEQTNLDVLGYNTITIVHAFESVVRGIRASYMPSKPSHTGKKLTNGKQRDRRLCSNNQH